MFKIGIKRDPLVDTGGFNTHKQQRYRSAIANL